MFLFNHGHGAKNNSHISVNGQIAYTTPGTFNWIVPEGITSVSVVCIGGGGDGRLTNTGSGGGGGGLGWKNNISVVPGQSYKVVVGAANNDSYFIDLLTVAGMKGSIGVGGTYVGTGGGNGKVSNSNGGGGAGGYIGSSGGGGNGGYHHGTVQPQYNTGAGGGGVGIFGIGSTGADGTNRIDNTGVPTPGGGGSNGASGAQCQTGGYNGTGAGGSYGGGGASNGTSRTASVGYAGAVRIIWGTGRSFPSTLTGNI